MTEVDRSQPKPGVQAARRTRMAPADRRALILDAAAALFRSHGYAGASIDAIAQASGISGPGIYRYFSGKTALLLALLESVVEDTLAAIAVATVNGRSSIDSVADVLAERALREGAVIALLQGTTAEMDQADRDRLQLLRCRAIGDLCDRLSALRPELGRQEAEGRVVAVLALVGHAERFQATGAKPESFRSLLRAVLRS